MLIDTHAHLNDERFAGKYQEIINSFEEDGIGCVVCVGFDRRSSEAAFDMAKQNRQVYFALGIHPHDSKDAREDDYVFFADGSAHRKAVAIGEIGLDYYHNFSPRETQKRVFDEQLALANEVGLPVILHIRDAFGDVLDILNANKNNLGSGGVAHCYSGSAEYARQLLDLGLMISFAGAVTHKNAARANEVLSQIPLKHILIETDCPYMTPEPHRGELNVPRNVRLVAEHIAKVKKISFEEVVAITHNNALSLFKKIKLKKI